MTDINYELYEQLYARYLDDKRTDQMIALAGPLGEKRVCDLCTGGGRLAKKVLEQKPLIVHAVDKSMSMLQGFNHYKNPFLMIHQEDIQTAVFSFNDNSMDAVFCQQGVNYWFSPIIIKRVSEVLSEKGVFIFNTFNKKPQKQPITRSYVISGRSYVEVSYSVDDVIYHVQMAEGLPMHLNTFMWVSPDTFMDTLGKYFQVDKIIEGPTTIYRCVKDKTLNK